jgi:hypothetical protein
MRALPIRADVVRAVIAVLVADFNTRIGPMGTFDSVADIERAFVSVIGARLSRPDALANAPSDNAGMHGALVGVVVADRPRSNSGERAKMRRVALILAAIPVADAFVCIAGSRRRIGANRADLCGKVRRALLVDAVACLRRIAKTLALAAGARAARASGGSDIFGAVSRAVTEVECVARLGRNLPAIRLRSKEKNLAHARTIASLDGAFIPVIAANRCRRLGRVLANAAVANIIGTGIAIVRAGRRAEVENANTRRALDTLGAGNSGGNDFANAIRGASARDRVASADRAWSPRRLVPIGGAGTAARLANLFRVANGGRCAANLMEGNAATDVATLA